MQHNWIWMRKCMFQRVSGTSSQHILPFWLIFGVYVVFFHGLSKKPISAHRFWGLQIILTSIPLVVYSIISQHMNEKLAKCWLMKRFKKKRERKKRKNRRILRWIYGFCSIARLAIGKDPLIIYQIVSHKSTSPQS